MSMDKLFDGSDAHLLPGNAELIQRLNEPELYYPDNFDTPRRANALLSGLCQEAADAIESADKRIAGLEEAASFNFEQYQDAAFRLCEANQRLEEERETYDRMLEEGANKLQELERKLAVAREALKAAEWNSLDLPEFVRGKIVEALAQIGGDDAGS